jgi:hypothetical protein
LDRKLTLALYRLFSLARSGSNGALVISRWKKIALP